MATEILLPRLTDTMHEGFISYWYKKEGEEVQEDEPLFVVETDKASVEVNSSATGVLLKILVNEGESVEVGGRVAIIGERGEDIQSLLAMVKPKEEEEREIRLEAAPSPTIKASPAAKRKAKEENVDLKEVTGTGEGGLITQGDVIEYSKKGRSPSEIVRRYGPEEVIPLEGVYPLINASLDVGKIIVKKYYNIGVSVASPRGLIVPVLHNAEGKDIYQLSRELVELAKKTRENRLSLEEVSGRTFTVTNSGVFGSLFSTPRINPPESAVLGMGKIMKQPVVRNEEITIRSMMYLGLSYDHRIIDGETAVKFLQEVKKALESPRILLDNR